ncbi:MAG: aminopeptidase P family protein [Sphaerochaetaceae bacterium]
MNTITNLIEKTQALLKSKGLAAWIIGGSDPHASEYVANRFQSRQWISGFTGSAGTCVITTDQALLWVDSRYYIQGFQQTEGTPFKVMKLHFPQVPDPLSYLAQHIPSGSKLAIDTQCTSQSEYRALIEAFGTKEIDFVDSAELMESLWTHRPQLPFSPVSRIADEVAGQSALQKISSIREVLAALGVQGTIISSLDDIAWILNLRGADIDYNRVFLSYLVILEQQVFLYTDQKRFDASVRTYVDSLLSLRPYEEFFSDLKTWGDSGKSLYLSPEKTSMKSFALLPDHLTIVEGRDISTDLKAIKSEAEIEGMRQAHLQDGIAMVMFLSYIERTTEKLNELSLAQKLLEFRKEAKGFIGPSFGTIAGFGAHGALAHYSATKESSSTIEGNSLLVLDSGGHYETGTTDITRTLLFGTPTSQMIKDYTLVLKGNLAVTSTSFPEGTMGYQIDTLARQFLWQHQMNYGHGTGHGVGFCLNVHEGPQSISARPLAVGLQEGMIVSNEPGLYRQGEYGIRLENLLVAQKEKEGAFGSFLKWEVLTLCPFERKLIDKKLLSDSEKELVDAYHRLVYSALKEHLDEEDAAWLLAATKPL